MTIQIPSASAERYVPVLKALDICNIIISSLNLKIELYKEGIELESYFCELSDKHGYMTSGMGKGLGLQSQASAIFEALEHYFHEIDNPKLSKIEYTLKNDCGLANSSLSLEKFCNIKTPIEFYSTEYVSLRNSNRSTFFFPIFLTDVNYSPRTQEEVIWLDNMGLKRYSTNSGTASGVNLEESLLHGLLELIERDSIGIELFNTVISKVSLPVRILNLEKLPIQINTIISVVESEANGKVTIYDITTNLGVPVYLSELKVKGKKYFGSGASLNSTYALERSILESLQVFHANSFIKRGLMGEESKQINILLPQYAKAYLENGVFEYSGGESYVNIQQNGLVATGSVKEQLDYLVELLFANGIPVYSRVIKDVKFNDFVVSQVIAPKLERFHLISHGLPVAPGFRAKSVENCH